MMVLDGCFIIEVFRIIEKVIERDPDDPLFTMIWTFDLMTRDFLQFENQIPFSVLSRLYDLSKSPADSQRSLIQLALGFFNWKMERPLQELEKLAQDGPVVSEIKHLLHLLQLTYTYSLRTVGTDDSDNNNLNLIQSANKLLPAGIKFKRAKSSEKLLDIRFNKGVFLIPPLTMDDFKACFFLNCIAFKQCYCYIKNHITTYVMFMACLMRTEKDSNLLSDCQILENLFGSQAEVASFFDATVKDVTFINTRCYLKGVFRGVNKYYNSWWSTIMRRYFSSPWAGISASAGLAAHVLTVVQTMIAFIAYYRPPK